MSGASGGGFSHGGGSGGGGAPSGAAGGDLGGTYPNPTVVAVEPSTITSAMIVDGTIVTGDLSATAGITSGQLAGSIAPSKITGTAITAADSGTVTTTILAAGIPQSLTSSGSSTKAIADSSAHVVGGPPVWNGTGWIGAGQRGYYLNGSSANVAETTPRHTVTSANQAIAATGVMASYAIELYAGMVITNISFRSGTVAGVTMTHWWVALYDTQATPALIAQSADQTSAAIGASTNFTVALGSPAPYTVTTSGVHYVSIMVAAATVPSIYGWNGPNAAFHGGVVTGQKALAVSSGSSLTTTAPATIASPTNLATGGYFVTS